MKDRDQILLEVEELEERISGTVEAFIGRLARLGLVETGQGGAQPFPHARRRGSLLYFRLKAFDPDRLLDRLVGKVRCFFTPYFIALSASLILLAFIITVANREEIGRDLLALYGIETLVLAWMTLVAVTTAHEFAHGLTCKRFGGQVHEMGFLLIYFQLAFYCNVSDAWLFPEKSKRLRVTLRVPISSSSSGRWRPSSGR
jgi:putative peptide zinc metalloprotease protein